jgi:hypothetical protein
MYLKCLLLLAASRRAANQHQEIPSSPIHFQAEFICTAFELVLVDGSKADSSAPLYNPVTSNNGSKLKTKK